MHADLIIRHGTLITADSVFAADLAITHGHITAILAPNTPIEATQTLDASGCYVLPGAIDTHVHLHMPTTVGYTADDWRTGTTAAALGGTTTIVDFVETQPGEHLLDALTKRLDETREAVIDFGLHMTMQPDLHPVDGIARWMSDERLSQMRAAYDAGCASFKVYQAYPTMQVRDADLLRVMQHAHELNSLVCVHSENGDAIDVLRSQVTGDVRHAIHHALTRPPINEHESVTRAVMCAEVSGARALIFHIGCEAAARVVAEAKARGLANLFGETCPQYLVLTDEQLKRNDGRLWICAPPLRAQQDQDAMWRMLASRALDLISTDHCPFTRAQKDAGKDDFRKTPGGVPGIEVRLGLVHHLGVRSGRLGLCDWVRTCCTRPAELHGLKSKGRIAIGLDADLVIFDPAIQKT
ncbi:MAG: amidohydrolase family protein [Anaerolineae bacterium]|nr:amidohydrolase family protein [Anaerolineae bacterium]